LNDVQGAILDAATQELRVPGLNESLAIVIVLNLRMLKMIEQVYDGRVSFDREKPVTLSPHFR